MKIKQLLAHIILCSLMLSLFGCFGGGKNKEQPTSQEESIDDAELIQIDSQEENSKDSFFDSSEPFYPLQETIDDIQLEMSELRAKILDYESRIKNQDNSLETLHKIQFPHLTHEIELTNGTLVNGNIIQENSDRMIVKTQIGQLTIDKANVATIKNISPNIPEVEFQGDAVDEIYPNHRIFSGVVYNDGFRRADFVRVIYKLWSERTELIGIDSSFVEGTKTVYKSGVISDTAIEPGQAAEFIIHVDADSSLVRYVTREIKWDTFD
tara:strand:- start:548 stop:1348 length:801 start_codon:yes stop_codon:yes gene_type:complete